MRIILVAALLLAMSLTAHAQTVTLVVSPVGSDHAKGTPAQPLRTIEKALAYAKGKQTTILLRKGTYYLDTTIVLNPSYSGLTIAAYNDEAVTISGGRKLFLKWVLYKNGIYKASVPAGSSFERLYVNGHLQTLARYPDYDSSARIFHGTSPDAIAPARVKTWQHPEGGYVHAIHGSEWGSFHYKILNADGKGNLQLDGGWQNNRPTAMHKQYRFVENIFEELNTVGEWFLDRRANELYYYPANKAELENAIIEVSHLSNLIEVKGTQRTPAKNILLKGLTFAHTERTFMQTREPLLRGDWTIYRGGAVLLQGTEDCAVKACNFFETGGNAIMVSNYNRRDTISGCYIASIGASAICFIGDTAAVRNAQTRYDGFIPYDQLDKTPGPKTDNYPQACVAIDNLIHNVGEIEKQAAGVNISMAAAITVSHNTIYNTPRAGININDGCWGGNIIEYNEVFNTVLETGDHGAFNSWGRDRFWYAKRKYMDSIVAAHPALIFLDVLQPNIIRYNRFRCDHGWDIDLDDGSGNYEIYNNVCLNGGLKLREGFKRIVQNNIIINNSFHPHVWFKNSMDVFKRNIVTRPYYSIRITDWGTDVDENLFPDTASLHTAQQNGTDRHSMSGDPLFIDAVNGNYNLQSNSPAIAIGFKPFPQDQFGVRDARLKALAMHTPIPALKENSFVMRDNATASFLGGIIKSIEGPAERSVYGLPDETGVAIISVTDNSLLKKSGLQEKDVLRVVNNKSVKDMGSLLRVMQSVGNKKQVPVELYRNQQVIKLVLLTE